ncbi:NADH dehydrogenase subunit 5 [Aneurinibacillus thermoaerophilus]|uniref:NADH dehydrogenase subunit 5 n=1 Tax=Aneurinibacillus thermoaerophilus TaxID=143495 RepID=UPI002E1D8D27|nr:NADH dehydrogenase subunit 5 [Aneurinibacillus thermoaerophilus]MED0763827.1 NADH dehydrogenase subunit 5 [Aneurinibacillus thermoaerophilus]
MNVAMFIAFIAGWMIAWISACRLCISRVSDRYVRLHVFLLAIPVVVSFAGWVSADQAREMGLWRLDRIAWMMAFYVGLLGWAIQRFCIRFMHGDRSYRAYFTLLTFTTGSASLIWFSGDLRLLVWLWGLPLSGLVGLVLLNKEWTPVRHVARLMSRMFAVSWLSLLLAAVWLWQVTGHWRITQVLSEESLLWPGWGNAAGIGALVVLAAIIPAGQWPFQRWLLESAVIPTPVSAAMHAGLVNAGGMLLARFSPLLDGGLPQWLLVVPAVVSIFVGTGILLVQPDYKRQLVASTLAQMGMMFLQCALGAYVLAVLHLIFHGWFKAALFLRSGSVVPRPRPALLAPDPPSKRWLLYGVLGGIVLGTGFWLAEPHEPLRLLRALLLGWSISLAWWQTAMLRKGRWISMIVLSSLGLSAMAFHDALATLLTDALPAAGSTGGVEAAVVLLIAFGGLAGLGLTARCPTELRAKLYLWLVHLGEARDGAVESHPRYLGTLARREESSS